MQLLDDVVFIENLSCNQLEFYQVGDLVQADISNEWLSEELVRNALFTNAYVGLDKFGYRKYEFTIPTGKGVKKLAVFVSSEKVICQYVGTDVLFKGEIVTVKSNG